MPPGPPGGTGPDAEWGGPAAPTQDERNWALVAHIGTLVAAWFAMGFLCPLVIMLTNHPTDYHRRWCREHGADFFFDKTSEFEKVLDVLGQRA